MAWRRASHTRVISSSFINYIVQMVAFYHFTSISCHVTIKYELLCVGVGIKRQSNSGIHPMMKEQENIQPKRGKNMKKTDLL